MSAETLRRDRPLGRGEAKDPLGRAARFACTLETGTTCELWCFSATDAALVKRLAGLGLRGVGGFDLGFGEDDEGAFLVRRVPSLTLDEMGKGERVEGLTALAKVRDLARALAACEEAAIFPGPLRPVDVALSGPGRTEAWIAAEHYVRALVGDAKIASGTSSGPSPRWTPPEQAAAKASDSYTATLKKSGLTLKIEPGQSLLDVILKAGVAADFSCHEGICGSCETRVLCGEVDHRDFVLSAEEKAANRSMMICVSGCKSEHLELDL